MIDFDWFRPISHPYSYNLISKQDPTHFTCTFHWKSKLKGDVLSTSCGPRTKGHGWLRSSSYRVRFSSSSGLWFLITIIRQCPFSPGNYYFPLPIRWLWTSRNIGQGSKLKREGQLLYMAHSSVDRSPLSSFNPFQDEKWSIMNECKLSRRAGTSSFATVLNLTTTWSTAWSSSTGTTTTPRRSSSSRQGWC